MTAIVDYPQVRNLPVGGRQLPVQPVGRPTTLPGRGSVVALRRRRAVTIGSLSGRGMLAGDRLVAADDVAGQSCWIPAAAVWSDGETTTPERPRPIGLAVAATRESAVLKGLSDRLGWEAVLEFEQRGDLPLATAAGQAVPNAIVLDGRLDHAVPTVVILGAETIRWGAAATWPGAIRRALFGEDANADPVNELKALDELLGGADLTIASVDLGTTLLSMAAVHRCSVQLLTGDAAVRSWDAD